jgi:molybdopterin converting factor subunit 1
MSIKILFFASIAELTGIRETRLEAGSYPDINSIINKLVADFPSLESHRASMLVALNSEFTRPETPVHDGDEVALFPPVSGG